MMALQLNRQNDLLNIPQFHQSISMINHDNEIDTCMCYLSVFETK